MKRYAAVLIVAAVAMTSACSSGAGGSSAPTPTPTTAKEFQVSTPEGQVSVSLNGNLPPNWPTAFPVIPGATVAGSGSLGGSTTTGLVGVYTTNETPTDALTFYASNPTLTTSNQVSAGAGSAFIGSVRVTAPYTGHVTVVSKDSTTYAVVTLKTSPTTTPAA